MVSSPGERLADVVAAAVEVAAEAGEAGTYTGEVARALAAVVNKVAVRATIDAEVRGFTSGWREAMDLVSGDDTGTVRILRLPEPPGVAPEAPAPSPGRGSGDGPDGSQEDGR
ncbi:hypothetical protein [Streptomyces sp. Wb2n-11]|uniref:hypothetical protein n=1 Tax=Streptomyces sp. Wb2n-11 TaxID=1030533 RepID=UPI000AA2E366|nr:hypothetical protein [Streptomyces sp. Wb2n-11]